MASTSRISTCVLRAALAAGVLVCGCGSDDNSKLAEGEGNGGGDAAAEAGDTTTPDATVGDDAGGNATASEDSAAGDATVSEDATATADAGIDATVAADGGVDASRDAGGSDAADSGAGGDGAPNDAASDAPARDAGDAAAGGGDAGSDAGPGVGTLTIACDYALPPMSYGFTHAAADPSGNFYGLSFITGTGGAQEPFVEVNGACQPVFVDLLANREAEPVAFGASAGGVYLLTHIDFSPGSDGVDFFQGDGGYIGGVESGDWLLGLDQNGKWFEIGLADDVLVNGIQTSPPMPTSIALGGSPGYSEVFDGGAGFYPWVFASDAGEAIAPFVVDPVKGTLVQAPAGVQKWSAPGGAIAWSSSISAASMAFDSHGDVIVLSPTLAFTKLSGGTGATLWTRPGPAAGSNGMWLDAADSIYVLGSAAITKYTSDGTAPLSAPLPTTGGAVAISPGHDPFFWTYSDIQVLHFSP